MREITDSRPDQRVHLTYTEPSGWTSPPDCLPDRETAERLIKATNTLSGQNAASRRTWRITPCDCDPR